MQLAAGLFLHSTAALNETYFAGATIYLTSYNADGAVGYIVNRPFGRSLHELEEFSHCRAFPLYEGGPVDQEHLFFIHRHPGLIAEGRLVADGIYISGDFSQVVKGIQNGNLNSNHLKIFVGYCGWDTGELEAEIAEGSWVVSQAEAATVFGA